MPATIITSDCLGDPLGAAAKIIPEDDDEVLEDAEMVVNEEEGNVEVPEVSVADVEENAEVVVEEASEVPELEEEDTEEPEVEESEDNFTL